MPDLWDFISAVGGCAIKMCLKKLWKFLLMGHRRKSYLDLFTEGKITFEEYLEREKREEKA